MSKTRPDVFVLFLLFVSLSTTFNLGLAQESKSSTKPDTAVSNGKDRTSNGKGQQSFVLMAEVDIGRFMTPVTPSAQKSTAGPRGLFPGSEKISYSSFKRATLFVGLPDSFDTASLKSIPHGAFMLLLRMTDDQQAVKLLKGMTAGCIEKTFAGESLFERRDPRGNSNFTWRKGSIVTNASQSTILSDGRRSTAGLDSAWKRCGNQAVTVAIDVERSRKFLNEMLAESSTSTGFPQLQGFHEMRLFERTRQMSVSFDWESKNLLELRLLANGRNEAAELRDDLNQQAAGLVSVVQRMQKSSATSSLKDAAMFRSFANSLKFTTNESLVSLVVQRPDGFKDYLQRAIAFAEAKTQPAAAKTQSADK